MTEFAAEPRPWQRMPCERANATMSCTVRKYGAYCSSAVTASSLSRPSRIFAIMPPGKRRRAPSCACATRASCGVAKPWRVSLGYSVFRSELLVEALADFRNHAAGKTTAGSLLRMRDKGVLRRGEALARLVGIFRLLQFIEGEAAAIEEAQRLRHRPRDRAKQPGHLLRPLQMPLGIGLQPAAGGLDRHKLADAGDDVLQRPPLGRVIEHVVGRDQRSECVAGDLGEARQPAFVVAAVEYARAEPDGPPRDLLQTSAKCRELLD